MRRSIQILLASIFFLSGCTSAKFSHYTFNQKTAAPELKEDIILLKKILEANHPSLYWYTSKDSIDYYFNNAINSINDSLTEIQFRNKVAFVISKIRCGHTSVRFSKDFNKNLKKHLFPQFPLYIKTWGDSMVVLGSITRKDSVFKRGTVITSINGKTNKQLLDSMFQLVNTDGYSDNYKSQVFSINFPYWYKIAWGLDSNYTVKHIDSLGKEKTTLVKNFSPVIDTTKKHIQPTVAKKPVKQSHKEKLLNKRSMNIDTAISTAFIRLTTFSDGGLRTFFRRSFRAIHQRHIKNVVIDVRENVGGNLNSSTLLTKYLINHPFKTGDTIVAINRNFSYKKYIPESFIFWRPMNFSTHKMSDGRYHNRRNETHFFQVKKRNHFNGNVYLLQGGLTFSAATMFVSNLKGQKNVTVVGEETGGGFYGNSAMHLPTIVLPNSKLRVVLPMFRLVMDSTRIKNGHGIFPDVSILPSSSAIKEGIDLKMRIVREMIMQQNTRLAQ
jgi:C-terminal processing protease CtpA/Prc